MSDIFSIRTGEARRMMARAGVDLLVAYSNGQHSMGTLDAVRWLSGFKPMSEAAVLLPKDGEAVLVVSPAWDEARAIKRGWVEEVVAGNDFAAAFEGAISKYGWGSAKKGLLGASRGLDPAVAGIDLDAQLERLAAVRDELELELMQQATDIAEKGYQHMLEVLRPGMREYELCAEIEHCVRSLGADDDFLLMAASRCHPSVRGAGDRVIDVGDVIIGEISPSAGGQFTQICRTAVLGPVSDLQREHHKLLADSMAAGMKAGRPGVKISEVVEAMNEGPIKAGYEKYCHPPYMRVRGHGLGLGSSMPGDLGPENQTVLEAGMTFVIHPNQFLPQTGYFMVGEPVVVTDEGLKPFTKRIATLDSVPA